MYLRKCHKEEKKGKKGGEKRGGGKNKQNNWRPESEPGTSALENLRKCHKNNNNSNNKVTLRSCEAHG